MRLLEFIIKEFRQLRRDRRMLPLIFMAPVFQLMVFGFAVSTDIKHLKVVVCDQDRTLQSRELTRDFESSEYFDYRGNVDTTAEIQREIDHGRASIAVVIPRGYERDVRAGDTARVQVLMDGSDANTGTVAMGYLGKLFQARGQRIIADRLTRIGAAPLARSGIDLRARYWYNPTLASRNYMVPGILCIIVGMITTTLTALSVVKERETGTMEQLVVTPIRPWEVMLGKMVPFLLVGFIEILSILVVGQWVFHVPMRGSIGTLLGLAGLFVTASLGIGLLISTVSQTQQQAMMAAVFFLMPSILISGFIFPVQNMPVVLQYVTYMLPMRYTLVIIRSIFLKGSGLPLLWDQVIPLALLTAAILALAVARFHKRVG